MNNLELKIPVFNGRGIKIEIDTANGVVIVSGMATLVCELPFPDRKDLDLEVDKETKLCLAIQGTHGDNWNFRVSHEKLMPWYRTVPIIQAKPYDYGGSDQKIQLEVRKWGISKEGWGESDILSLLPYPLAESES